MDLILYLTLTTTVCLHISTKTNKNFPCGISLAENRTPNRTQNRTCRRLLMDACIPFFLSPSLGQDPRAERGDVAGRVRAVPEQDGGGDHAGGARDARGTPEGNHGVDDGRGKLVTI
jgi:hypothetical protein